ncbi:MAG TPA: flagellar biosynthesis anti-sigma factor FlgM [Myxococcales bacterium]|jgi:anti-sigma28 factor (negative regulator of flagellin synthesis)|nr:flagellar biosynthesis anti-sigma factor FlgM [Myxococcales bacterium]
MKVNGTQEIATLTTAPRAGTPSSTSAPQQADTVDTPQIAQQAMAAQSVKHQNKVDNIASQVKSGTYVWPTSQQIADKIMDDAELTARLQAMFRA